jgi:histidyl-tRNA synthetase
LGIERGQYRVKVNNRNLLDGVMYAVAVEDERVKLSVLRAIDKLDRLGQEGVDLLLGAGRKDASGDVTEGAGLNEEQRKLVREFFTISDLADLAGGYDFEAGLAMYSEDSPFRKNKFFQKGAAELADIGNILVAAGYESDRVCFSPSVVRGLEYYTGPVFEVELLLETRDEKGRPVRFGSVGGGGRYDGLVSRFRGEPVPATGFSIGVSRLQAALSLIGKLDTKSTIGPVVVTIFDKDRIADYQAMAAQLRAAGIRAELYLGNPKHSVGQQLKYADKRNAPCAIIAGPDEMAAGKVTIKDLAAGAELAGDEKNRDDYLAKQAQAQRTVPVAQLVETVRAVLAGRS